MLSVHIDRFTVTIGTRFTVSFQRTLRIPDDGQVYPLPPGLGAFPIERFETYSTQLPAAWHGNNSAFITMYQREALWLGFNAASWKPNAVKIGIGGFNVLSGQVFDHKLRNDPQDYIVVPPQPWLDGFKTGHGVIRQFVAMPLGQGYTVEASLADSEERGDIQIIVYEPKPGIFPDEPPKADGNISKVAMQRLGRSNNLTMGLGAGGEIKQKIYPDGHGLDVWDQDNVGEVTVHIVNSEQYKTITDKLPPPTPIDVHTYSSHGFPWFELYDEDKRDLEPSENLSTAKTITQVDEDRGINSKMTESVQVKETQIKKLKLDELNSDHSTSGSTGRRCKGP